ncbi:MAG: RHS repeat protein, partial [Ruminococcaceae bacterium]|nr:RHS repeat protein [Oscillospiraceae bacterium]
MQKSKTTIITKLVSFALSLLILFYAIPSIVYAETIDALSDIGNKKDGASADASESVSGISLPVYEVEELREENVKHFKLSDGSYVAAQYTYPVHYDGGNGKLLDIDNSLREASGGVFANENARIKFAKKITGNGSLFTLHDGSKKIELSLDGAKKGTAGSVTNGEDAEDATELQKMMNLEKLSSSVVYKDILDGVDVEYVVQSLNIKENIIVKEKKSEYIFSFELKLNGLTAALTESGSIELTDSKTGEVDYVIPAPVIYDANGIHAESGVGAYTLSGGGNGKYTLSVTVSSEWMNSADRAFPVTVDPAIVNYNVSAVDLSISSYTPDTVSVYDEVLYVSSTDIAFWRATTLPTIPSTAYVTKAELSFQCAQNTYYRYVCLHEVLTSWDSTLTWNKHTSTTSPKGRISDTVTDYAYLNGKARYTWDITPLFKKWKAGTNYGIALQGYDDSFLDTSFYSYEAPTAADEPTLLVTYKNMSGTEAYWSYSSHSVGVAGSGSINLATGNLTFIVPTLSTTDSLMPYTPTLVYDSSFKNKYYTYTNTETANVTEYMPAGFKLNICETVLQKKYTNNNGDYVYYYVYADADGTEHGFHLYDESTGVYADENGLQKTLTVLSDGSIEITDDNKTKRTFTKYSNSYGDGLGGWYLTKITDRNGNAVIFTFDSSIRPTKVSIKPNGLTQIDFLNLYYYSTGRLKMIYNSTSKDAVVFRYSATSTGSISTTTQKYLRQIDYAHGNSSVTLTNWDNFASSASNTTNITVDASATYTYDYYGCLTYVNDLLAVQRFQYQWTNNSVTTLIQLSGNTKGQQLSYTYGVGYTDVVSCGNDELPNTDDDITTRYVFDGEGRSKSVYSYSKNGTEVYGATVGKYETQENVKNNLKEQTTLGGSAVNYLLNGSFEKITSDGYFQHWEKVGTVQADTIISDFDGVYYASFVPTTSQPASLSQYVKLGEGKYTLSLKYSTTVSDKYTATVSVSSVAGTGFSHTEQLSLNQNYSNGTKPVFSTSFTLETADTLKVTIQLTANTGVGSSPNFKVDCVMLENNLGASDFSLVNYGSFEASGTDSAGAVTPLSTYWSTDGSQSVTVVTDNTTFGNSAKVTASINNAKYLKQRIYQASSTLLDQYNSGASFVSNANEEYIVSGFGKAAGAVYSDRAAFRIRVEVLYYQGANYSYVKVPYYFDFAPNCTGWQFTGGSFSTAYEPEVADGKDYSCVYAIDVYCDYSYQPNGYALFDGISVTGVTGESVERYSYYENGLLAKKVNRYYEEYYYYYDNRNLKRVANNRGELTDYTYTASNQPSTVVECDFTWNGYIEYPDHLENHETAITLTPKIKTAYTYNTYGLTTRVETYPLDNSSSQLSGSKKLYSAYSYRVGGGEKIFGALSWEIDSLGTEIQYYYDSSNGQLLASVNISENTGICYTYDDMGNLIGVMPASYVNSNSYTAVTGAENVSYTYNEKNLLSEIITDSTTYTFTYDLFGNTTSVNAGDNELCEYTYAERNGKLQKITYGNGYIVEYVYNDIELLTEVWYTKGTEEKTLAYEYEYTSDGQIHELIDHGNEKSTVYKYDTNNRLIGFIEYANGDHYHDFSANLSYNDKGELGSVYYYLNFTNNGVENDFYNWRYLYSYENDGRLSNVQLITEKTNGREYFYYDEYDRVSSKRNYFYLSSSSLTKFDNQISYTYKTYSDRTSSLVETYTSTVNSGTALTYTYTYDQNGNITKVVYSTGQEIRYVYDDLGQLLREDNGLLNKTYVYTYDNAGNITSKKTYALTAAGTTPTSATSTYSYGYSSGAWGDLLTSYRGQAITYDAIGNPLSYYNGSSYTFTWTGRQLTGATKGGHIFTFTYNDEGIRTSKTKNGVTTTYYLNGSQIMAEETSGNVTVYLYDSQGMPIGMQY